MVNNKPVAEKDLAILRTSIGRFSALPQATLMCNRNNASLYIGPDYRNPVTQKGEGGAGAPFC